MADFISRGFSGRRRDREEVAKRLPPGQYDEHGFPVLTAGPTPRIEHDEWRFRIDGMVANPSEWTREQFDALPFETVPCDIHCVTKWSKLGTSFGGVSVDALLEPAEPLGAYATAYSHGGYTTNLPVEDLTDGKAWVVIEHEGEPLPREHGGPAPAVGPPPRERPGTPPTTRASPFLASTAGPPGCSCRTSTSGRAPSGSPGSGSWTTTSRASGR